MPDKKEEVKDAKPKPCCACPETRKPRDEWLVINYFNDTTKLNLYYLSYVNVS